MASALSGQDCTSCPAGSAVDLVGGYPTAVSHTWVCTDGFTSSLANPTFYPTQSTTCYLTATDAAGCVALDTLVIEVCNCACNDPCVGLSYNPTSDCVKIFNTGSTCSSTSSDNLTYKPEGFPMFIGITSGDSICDCAIKEYINTTASVSVSGSNFRLQVSGLKNRCHNCTSSDLRISCVFPVSTYNTTMFPGCSASEDWLTISPSDFANAGYVANFYVRYDTPIGTVVNYYTYTYNGGGLNASNVTITEVYKKTIYKSILAKRVVNYSDGCPSTTCEVTLDVPQQPPGACTHFVTYMQFYNLGSPCGGQGLGAVVLNGTTPISYQWYYNGSQIPGATDQFLCLVGRSYGTYCVEIEDAEGCIASPCTVWQAPCSLTASIYESSGILYTSLANCSGSASYQWQYWTGSTWSNVGTGSSYNTGGVSGDYRVQVNCSGPPACKAIANYTYLPPCTADVTLTVGSSTLTANVTGCGGTTIAYVWERWTGTAWTTVRTQNKTSTTDTYTPSVSGLYRISITCKGCTDSAQTTFTMPDPCSSYTVGISGSTSSLCTNTNRTFTASLSGGTPPYSYTWKIGGSTVGSSSSYVLNRSTPQTVTLVLTVVDNAGCSKTASVTIAIIHCCGVTASVSPASSSVCTNTNETYTASASGGTAPYTYQWQTQLPPNPPVSQGSGNPKTFNFSNAGTYNITVTATDNTGCSAQATATMTVTNCTSCDCTPALSLSGCQLNGSFTGAGCGNFSYQLQYSATGTGWSAVDSGTASPGGTITHTPASNGFYRLVIQSGSCGLKQTADVSVNCVASCGCTPASLDYTGCKLSWTNPCSGYTADLERYSGGTWIYVTQTSPYTPAVGGDYRVAYKKSGCSTVTSNTKTVSLYTDCGTPWWVYYDDDTDVPGYLPTKSTIPELYANPGGNVFINLYSFTEGFCGSQADYSTWTVDYGDGSATKSGSSFNNGDTHVYSAGIYTASYELTSTLGTTEEDIVVTPDGTPYMPYFSIRAGCYDGGEPVAFERTKCDTVGLQLVFYFFGGYVAQPTYVSHYVKIDGTTYPTTMGFIQTAPNVLWAINEPVIDVPLSVVNNKTVPVELSVTFSLSGSNYTVRKKFFIQINCS